MGTHLCHVVRSCKKQIQSCCNAPASHRSVQHKWSKEVTWLPLLILAIATLRGVTFSLTMQKILECNKSKDCLSILNIFLNVALSRPRILATVYLRNSPRNLSLRRRFWEGTSSSHSQRPRFLAMHVKTKPTTKHVSGEDRGQEVLSHCEYGMVGR